MYIRASILMSACLSLAACGDDAVQPTDTRDASEVFVPSDVSGDIDATATDTRVEVADTAAEVADTSAEVADTSAQDILEVLDTQAETVADTAPVDTAADTVPVDTAEVQETTPETEVTLDTSDASQDVPDAVPGCDHVGFTSVAADGLAFANGDIWYLSQDTLGAPVSVLSIEIYAALGGAQAVGTYPITDENLADCGNCVLLETGCDDTLFNCTRSFLATSGSMEVTSIGGEGAHFAAQLSDLKFVEITYDDDYFSTPVVGGETWCVPSQALDVVLQ